MPDYLVDTNSIIYFFDGEEKISELIEGADNRISISFITKIELLCFETEDDSVIEEIGRFIEEIITGIAVDSSGNI